MERGQIGIVRIEMLVVCLLIVESVGGTVHTVGESGGWTLGVDYDTWSTSQTFLVGDTLVFKYGSGHTVDEVSEKDYKTCTEGKAISRDNSGSTSIILQTPATHYFICGVVGHCTSGMKLSVLVSNTASTSSPNNPPTPTPPLASTPTTPIPPAGYAYGYGYMIPYSASHPLHLTSPLLIFITIPAAYLLFFHF